MYYEQRMPLHNKRRKCTNYKRTVRIIRQYTRTTLLCCSKIGVYVPIPEYVMGIPVCMQIYVRTWSIYNSPYIPHTTRNLFSHQIENVNISQQQDLPKQKM